MLGCPLEEGWARFLGRKLAPLALGVGAGALAFWIARKKLRTHR